MTANAAWEALLAAHSALMKDFAARDIWEDVSMKEYDVLYTLSKCPSGGISLTELHRHVLLSQPALSRMVDRLAGRGLVARATDPRDGRGVRLSLTAAGRALQHRIGQRHARDVAAAVGASLTFDEIRQLEAICRKLSQARKDLTTMLPQLQPTHHLVVVSAGTSDPSSSRMLADRVAARVQSLAAARGHSVTVSVVELRELATELAAAMTSQLIGPRLRAAVSLLAEADGLVVSAPVYKAGMSGLFTSFFQVLDNDLLIGKPVVLAATAGTARHALVIDDQMRSLFAYLRTLPVPTSLFAAPEDWSDAALGTRTDRAATELLLLMESGFARAVRDEAWGSYQHEFGSAAGPEMEIDLDTAMMRLATGGSAV